MSEPTQADGGELEIEDRGETLTVPKTLERSDLSAWYGDVPDEIRVDRVFRYDDVVRAEMHVDGAEWVEVGYFRDGDFKPGTDTGWVAERLSGTEDADAENAPGETLWSRD